MRFSGKLTNRSSGGQASFMPYSTHLPILFERTTTPIGLQGASARLLHTFHTFNIPSAYLQQGKAWKSVFTYKPTLLIGFTFVYSLEKPFHKLRVTFSIIIYCYYLFGRSPRNCRLSFDLGPAGQSREDKKWMSEPKGRVSVSYEARP